MLRGPCDKMAARQPQPRPAVGGNCRAPSGPGAERRRGGNTAVVRPGGNGEPTVPGQVRTDSRGRWRALGWHGAAAPGALRARSCGALCSPRRAGGAAAQQPHQCAPAAHARSPPAPHRPRAPGREMATAPPAPSQSPPAPTSKVTRPRGSPLAQMSKKTTGLAMARHEQSSRHSSVRRARRSRTSTAPRRPLYRVWKGPPPPQRRPMAAG